MRIALSLFLSFALFGCFGKLEAFDGVPETEAADTGTLAPETDAGPDVTDSATVVDSEADVYCWTHQRHLPDGAITPCPPEPKGDL
jgi:hypothetical protein